MSETKTPTNNYHIKYQAHVENKGWLPVVRDGMTAGTTGQSLRLEALRFDFSEVRTDPKIIINSIKIHLQELGWKEYSDISSSSIIGTVSESRRAEAIIINCSNIPSGYNLYYRTHIQGANWTDWVTNGQQSGTTGESKRMEAIEILLAQSKPSNKGE